MCVRSRGQASVELLIVLSAIVLLMSLMAFFLYQTYVRGDELKIFIHGTRLVNTVADNVNEISIVGGGYSQYFALPEFLYGNRNYRISFFRNESTVYLQGGSFLRGVEIVWSAPISTTGVKCLMSECNDACNTSVDDVCLLVNDTMDVRVTNEDGVVYLTYPYNVRQETSTFYVKPIVGNLTYDSENCPGGSFIYIYQNRDDRSMNLVFRHNSSSSQPVQMDFYDIMGELNVMVSDDPGELDLNNAFSEGDWRLTPNECDGGVISFKEGIHLCIRPSFQGGIAWSWLNGDGTVIPLDKSKDLCLSYP